MPSRQVRECVFGETPLPLRGAGTAASSRAVITKGAANERERGLRSLLSWSAYL